ncbi:hypothetical protein FRC09_012699, partial [Ceratobasidium sp. 395]
MTTPPVELRKLQRTQPRPPDKVADEGSTTEVVVPTEGEQPVKRQKIKPRMRPVPEPEPVPSARNDPLATQLISTQAIRPSRACRRPNAISLGDVVGTEDTNPGLHIANAKKAKAVVPST